MIEILCSIIGLAVMAIVFGLIPYLYSLIFKKRNPEGRAWIMGAFVCYELLFIDVSVVAMCILPSGNTSYNNNNFLANSWWWMLIAAFVISLSIFTIAMFANNDKIKNHVNKVYQKDKIKYAKLEAERKVHIEKEERLKQGLKNDINNIDKDDVKSVVKTIFWIIVCIYVIYQIFEFFGWFAATFGVVALLLLLILLFK